MLPWPARKSRDVRKALSLHGLPPTWIALTLHALSSIPQSAVGLAGAEIFAGEAKLSAGLSKFNGLVATFDLKDGPEQDILTLDGVVLILQYILCTVVEGLLWLGTPCCSWVILSRSSTRRSALLPGGPADCTDFVATHNCIAELCSLLARTAYACRVYFIFEQPQSSLLYKYRPVQETLSHCGAVTCHVWMGAFDGETPKPLVLKSTAPWLGSVFQIVCSELHKAMPRKARTVHLCKSQLTANGTKRFTGVKNALRSSAAYTAAFGEAIGLAHRGHDATHILSHISKGRVVKGQKRRIFGMDKYPIKKPMFHIDAD